VLKQIIIRGRTYTLRADDGDDIELVAADVDRRMREMASRSVAFDDYTVALLTAMNLASEVRALRRRLVERLEDLDHRVAGVEALLEAAVGESERDIEEV
jgi:cell division protein ZapA (FtsZ GTPase activity inhibitor)